MSRVRSFRSIRRFCTKGAQRTYSSEYYENVLGGVVTRDHFNAETNREETEIGNLGRLYIYQYHCCPYCSKVKSFLDFYKIPYSLVEVNPIKKDQMPDRRVFFHKKAVPILMVNPAQANLWGKAKVLYDSNKIINVLFSHLIALGKIDPQEFERGSSPLVSAWSQWIDEKLIPHLFACVHSNGTHQAAFFAYLEEFPKFFKYGLGNKVLPSLCMSIFSQQVDHLREVHGIKKGEEVKKCADVLREWHEITENSFHGGGLPDAADIMCYGALKTFNRMDFFTKLLNDSGVSEWYEATEYIIGDEGSCQTHF